MGYHQTNCVDMDEEMEPVEIVFAQRLASGEVNIRKRALKFLREHIKQESAKDAFTHESLARLCKGLHYALWMQDKMLLQEELADNICELVTQFEGEQKGLEFASALIFSLSKEWPSIDRWRMDKFLLLIRRLVRALLRQLSRSAWAQDKCELYLKFFTTTLLSAHSRICESLKFHCASLWLDELDNAAAECVMDMERCLYFLRPYIQLMGEDISDTFFRSICTDIFDTILHDFSEQLALKKATKMEEMEEGTEEVDEEDQIGMAKGEKSAEKAEETIPAGLAFDYGKIGELLFEVGKQQQQPSKRRKRLYALSKKFENASRGIDPFPAQGGSFRGKRRK